MLETRRRHGLRDERIRASKQYADGCFRNVFVDPLGMTSLAGPKPPTPPLSVMGEFFFRRAQRTPPGPLPLERPHTAWRRPIDGGLRVTWLGHSTVLLEIDGFRLLTDPVFGERASPLDVLGPKRFHPVPVELEELPPLDAVLLSHDHYDHLCRPTMTRLARMQVPIVTSLGVGAHLERFGVAPQLITELDWHESTDVRSLAKAGAAATASLRLTATPAQHFSGRRIGDRNKTLWSSWVIASDRHKIFFSGDTGLTPLFADVGRAHGPFDLVMLEVGAFHPAWGTIHLGPANALIVNQMLGGKTLLPVHWGTFNLALHDWDEPAETLVQLAHTQGQRVITPRLGLAFEPDRLDGPTPWWREVAAGHVPSTMPLVPCDAHNSSPSEGHTP